MHAVPNPCLTTNGGCSHFCLLSAVDPRGYICDCPDGMILGDGSASNCTLQIEITTVLSPSLLGITNYSYNRWEYHKNCFPGSCMANGHSSCCNNSCQDNSLTCYCDTICHDSGILDCCSDVPLDCEQGTYAHAHFSALVKNSDKR